MKKILITLSVILLSISTLTVSASEVGKVEDPPKTIDYSGVNFEMGSKGSSEKKESSGSKIQDLLNERNSGGKDGISKPGSSVVDKDITETEKTQPNTILATPDDKVNVELESIYGEGKTPGSAKIISNHLVGAKDIKLKLVGEEKTKILPLKTDGVFPKEAFNVGSFTDKDNVEVSASLEYIDANEDKVVIKDFLSYNISRVDIIIDGLSDSENNINPKDVVFQETPESIDNPNMFKWVLTNKDGVLVNSGNLTKDMNVESMFDDYFKSLNLYQDSYTQGHDLGPVLGEYTFKTLSANQYGEVTEKDYIIEIAKPEVKRISEYPLRFEVSGEKPSSLSKIINYEADKKENLNSLIDSFWDEGFIEYPAPIVGPSNPGTRIEIEAKLTYSIVNMYSLEGFYYSYDQSHFDRLEVVVQDLHKTGYNPSFDIIGHEGDGYSNIEGLVEWNFYDSNGNVVEVVRGDFNSFYNIDYSQFKTGNYRLEVSFDGLTAEALFKVRVPNNDIIETDESITLVKEFSKELYPGLTSSYEIEDLDGVAYISGEVLEDTTLIKEDLYEKLPNGEYLIKYMSETPENVVLVREYKFTVDVEELPVDPEPELPEIEVPPEIEETPEVPLTPIIPPTTENPDDNTDEETPVDPGSPALPPEDGDNGGDSDVDRPSTEDGEMPGDTNTDKEGNNSPGGSNELVGESEKDKLNESKPTGDNTKVLVYVVSLAATAIAAFALLRSMFKKGDSEKSSDEEVE